MREFRGTKNKENEVGKMGNLGNEKQSEKRVLPLTLFFIQTILEEPNDDKTINLKLVNARGRAQGSDLELEWMKERG